MSTSQRARKIVLESMRKDLKHLKELGPPRFLGWHDYKPTKIEISVYDGVDERGRPKRRLVTEAKLAQEIVEEHQELAERIHEVRLRLVRQRGRRLARLIAEG